MCLTLFSSLHARVPVLQTVSSLAAQRGMFLDITGKLGTVRRMAFSLAISPSIAPRRCGRRALIMCPIPILQLGSKFPVVSNLVTAIRRKKSKDTMILSAVVAGCTILMLLYWFNK